MAKTVALVACVSKKQTYATAAQDLYCSDWFFKASSYAKQAADEWCVLSAKYGLLPTDKVIEPYKDLIISVKVRDQKGIAQTLERWFNLY